MTEPIEDKNFTQNNNGWILSEQIVDSKTVLIGGVILGLILVGILSFIISNFTLCSSLDFYVYKKLYLILFVIPLHELFHLLFFPNVRNSLIGFSWRKAVFYASTNEVFSRRRLLLAIVMPLVLLTLIPFILLFIVNSEIIAYIALYNLIGCGIDIISFYKTLNLPKNHLFKFNGTRLYMSPFNKV